MLLPLLLPYNISAHLSIYFCKEIIKDTDFKNIGLSLFLKHSLKLSSNGIISILCVFHETEVSVWAMKRIGLHPCRGKY